MPSSQTEDLEYKINAYPDLALLLSLTITEDPAKDCPVQMLWNTEINSKVVSFVCDDRRDTHSIQWPPKTSLLQILPGVGRRLKQLLPGEGSRTPCGFHVANKHFEWKVEEYSDRFELKAFKAFLRQRNQEQALADIDFSLSAPGKVTFSLQRLASDLPAVDIRKYVLASTVDVFKQWWKQSI